jgi:hypothetical protein
MVGDSLPTISTQMHSSFSHHYTQSLLHYHLHDAIIPSHPPPQRKLEHCPTQRRHSRANAQDLPHPLPAAAPREVERMCKVFYGLLVSFEAVSLIRGMASSGIFNFLGGEVILKAIFGFLTKKEVAESQPSQM